MQSFGRIGEQKDKDTVLAQPESSPIEKKATIIPAEAAKELVPEKKEEEKLDIPIRIQVPIPEVAIFNNTGGSIILSPETMRDLSVEYKRAFSGSGPGHIGRIFNKATPRGFAELKKLGDKILKTPVSIASVIPLNECVIKGGSHRDYSYFNQNGKLKSWAKKLFPAKERVFIELIEAISKESLSFILRTPEEKVSAEFLDSPFRQQVINVSRVETEPGVENYLLKARKIYEDSELLAQLSASVGMAMSYLFIDYGVERDKKLDLPDLSHIEEQEEFEKARLQQKTYTTYLNYMLGKILSYQRLLVTAFTSEMTRLNSNYAKYMRERGTISVEKVLPFLQNVRKLKSSNKDYLIQCLSNLCCDPLTRTYLMKIANIALAYPEHEAIFNLAIEVFEKEYAIFEKYKGSIPESDQVRLVESAKVLENLIKIKTSAAAELDAKIGSQNVTPEDICFFAMQLANNLFVSKKTKANVTEVTLLETILELCAVIFEKPGDSIAYGLLQKVLSSAEYHDILKQPDWKSFIDTVELLFSTLTITDKNFLATYAVQFNLLNNIISRTGALQTPSKGYVRLAKTLLETKHKNISNHPKNLKWINVAIAIDKIPHHFKLYELCINYLNQCITQDSTEDLVKLKQLILDIADPIYKIIPQLSEIKEFPFTTKQLANEIDSIFEKEKVFAVALEKIAEFVRLKLRELQEFDMRHREKLYHDMSDQVIPLTRQDTDYYMQEVERSDSVDLKEGDLSESSKSDSEHRDSKDDDLENMTMSTNTATTGSPESKSSSPSELMHSSSPEESVVTTPAPSPTAAAGHVVAPPLELITKNESFLSGYSGWKKWALAAGIILLAVGITVASGGIGAIPAAAGGLMISTGFGLASLATIKNRVFQAWYQVQHWAVKGFLCFLGGVALASDLLLGGGFLSVTCGGPALLTAKFGLSAGGAVGVKGAVDAVAGSATGYVLHRRASSTRMYSDHVGGLTIRPKEEQPKSTQRPASLVTSNARRSSQATQPDSPSQPLTPR